MPTITPNFTLQENAIPAWGQEMLNNISDLPLGHMTLSGRKVDSQEWWKLIFIKHLLCTRYEFKGFVCTAPLNLTTTLWDKCTLPHFKGGGQGVVSCAQGRPAQEELCWDLNPNNQASAFVLWWFCSNSPNISSTITALLSHLSWSMPRKQQSSLLMILTVDCMRK